MSVLLHSFRCIITGDAAVVAIDAVVNDDDA